jgi:hypothetical protein
MVNSAHIRDHVGSPERGGYRNLVPLLAARLATARLPLGPAGLRSAGDACTALFEASWWLGNPMSNFFRNTNNGSGNRITGTIRP